MAIRDKLAFCIPELDLDVVTEPVMCNPCIEKLHAAFNFKHQCLQNEQQIRTYQCKCNKGKKKLNLMDMLSESEVEQRESKINERDSSNQTVQPKVQCLEISNNRMSTKRTDAADGINLEQWDKFEEKYLNKYNLQTLNELLGKPTRSCKEQKSMPTNKIEKKKRKSLKVKNKSLVLKPCSVILNRNDILVNKKARSTKRVTFSNVTNKETLLGSNDLAITKKNGTSNMKYFTMKRKYRKVAPEKKSKSASEHYSCSRCDYSTNVQIDLELHAVVHTPLD